MAFPIPWRYDDVMKNPAATPVVSAIVTVFNKAAYLPATIASLRRQMPDERLVEYIFVDDASSDGSVAVIEEAMADAPHYRMIANPDNRGPSIRLNQGARQATAFFLYFLDGDDIALGGAMAGMLDLLQKEKADLIYGKTATAKEGRGVIEADPKAPHTVSETPLAYIMKGGFVRMALMCRRDLFLEAGGADERIFVQDESLPLRLAARATRFIDWQAKVIARPAAGASGSRGTHISSDRTQLHHDAFFAYANALEDVRETHPDLAPKLYAKAVSAYWKFGKRRQRSNLLHPGFWRYLQTKSLSPVPNPAVLAWMADELLALPNIRRPAG